MILLRTKRTKQTFRPCIRRARLPTFRLPDTRFVPMHFVIGIKRLKRAAPTFRLSNFNIIIRRELKARIRR